MNPIGVLVALSAAALTLLPTACERGPEPAAGPRYADAPVGGLPLYRLAIHPLQIFSQRIDL
jgi:hypothetical protein